MKLTDYAALFSHRMRRWECSLSKWLPFRPFAMVASELSLRLETQLLKLVTILEQRTRRQQISKSTLTSGLESAHTQLPFLFETALTIARARPSPEEIAEKLADLIRQMIDKWPAIGPALRPALSNLCEGLLTVETEHPD